MIIRLGWFRFSDLRSSDECFRTEYIVFCAGRGNKWWKSTANSFVSGSNSRCNSTWSAVGNICWYISIITCTACENNSCIIASTIRGSECIFWNCLWVYRIRSKLLKIRKCHFDWSCLFQTVFRKYLNWSFECFAKSFVGRSNSWCTSTWSLVSNICYYRSIVTCAACRNNSCSIAGTIGDK